MTLKKLLAFIVLLAVLFTIPVIYFCDKKITQAGKGKIYTDVVNIPFNRTGLLLGTGKFLQSGAINPYYAYRIQAAASLKHSGKIQYIIISGDNSRKAYNEPETMRSDLIAQGVDSNCLYLDYAGFRTFDSVVRSKAIFGQETVTIISQQFHNERALYIAARENIRAVAFNAEDLGKHTGLMMKFREKLARVKVFIDYMVNKKPKFLGEKIIIS